MAQSRRGKRHRQGLLAPTEVTGFSVTFAPTAPQSLPPSRSHPGDPQGELFRSPLLGGTPEHSGEKRCGAVLLPPAMQEGAAFAQPYSARAATLLLVANLNGSDQREIAARPFAQTFIERTLAWSPTAPPSSSARSRTRTSRVRKSSVSMSAWELSHRSRRSTGEVFERHRLVR